MKRSPLVTRMAMHIETLLTVNATDDEQIRLGRLFILLMVISAGIVVCLTAAFLLLRPLGLDEYRVGRTAAAFPFVFLPLSLYCIFVARRGRVGSSISLYVWVNFIAIGVAAWLFDGSVSPAWLLYIWTITIAGTLLTPAHSLKLTGAVVAYYLLLALLSHAGVYEPPLTFGPRARAFVDAVFLLLMLVSSVGLLTYLNMRSLRETLARLHREIAERKHMEAGLRESEKKLRDLTANLGEGLLVQDKAGDIVFLNPEAERLTGWTMDEMNERGPHHLIYSRRPDGSRVPLEECKMRSVVRTGERYMSSDGVFIRKDKTSFPISVITAPIRDDGEIVATVTSFLDITNRKKIERERECLIEELRDALKKVRTLSGLIPICASCKKIRDDRGYWNQLESYLLAHSDAEFTHGMCPDCANKIISEFRKSES